MRLQKVAANMKWKQAGGLGVAGVRTGSELRRLCFRQNPFFPVGLRCPKSSPGAVLTPAPAPLIYNQSAARCLRCRSSVRSGPDWPFHSVVRVQKSAKHCRASAPVARCRAAAGSRGGHRRLRQPDSSHCRPAYPDRPRRNTGRGLCAGAYPASASAGCFREQSMPTGYGRQLE